MKISTVPTVVLAGYFALTACSPAAPPSPLQPASTATLILHPRLTSVPTQPPLSTVEGNRLTSARGDLFVGSGICAACHTSLADEAGQDVSMDTLWRTSLMANSARDPYWQASVRRETLLTPNLRSAIEDTCSRCHMPMARTAAVAAGSRATVLDDGFLSPDSPLHALAMDGVSCSACHQIEADPLGQPAAFDGQFVIDTHTPMGERPAYGPFVVDQDNGQIMKAASGLVPTQGEQMGQSELCATCHTLYTSFLDAEGSSRGEFPEQMPYLEWKASRYAGQQTCQACHMPEADGAVILSVTGGPSRQPVRMHSFLGGGNTVLGELRVGGDRLGVTASSAQFDDEIGRMTLQLQVGAAAVDIQGAALEAGTLTAKVVVKNLAGHKFPTAFPSRRAWLHITVTDSADHKVFESGAYDSQGRIRGNANDEDPFSFEPHYATLTGPDQVQIYEDIMLNSDGQVTTTLMKASRYAKDNRLLPLGFDKAAADADIAVVGEALNDSDFMAGGDTLQLSLDAGSATGPITLDVELLYQSVGYRWASNVGDVDAAENRAFASMHNLAGNPPVTVSSAKVEVR